MLVMRWYSDGFDLDRSPFRPGISRVMTECLKLGPLSLFGPESAFGLANFAADCLWTHA